jgi:hypothetical protein
MGVWDARFVLTERARGDVLLTFGLPPPSPLPCFLEVLILKDFKSFEPEVLILMEFKSLFPEVLIPVGLKGLRMSELRKVLNFVEVLIPAKLWATKCANGWI